MARAFFSRAAVPYARERIPTPDDDFLDLDWHLNPSAAAGDVPLAVYCHGLEGNSASTYIPLTIQALQPLGWHSLAWNYRSCSEEMNRQARFYHLGDTSDLTIVLKHAQHLGHKKIVLIGFSAGGSVVVNLLGKRSAEALALGVVAAAAISAPMDLEGAARRLETPGSQFYNHRFCMTLMAKLRLKAAAMGNRFPLDMAGMGPLTQLRAFDDLATAPLHGFASAADYYKQCSGAQFLADLPVPTLLWTARNDPFLSASSYPPEGLTGTWPNLQGHYPDEGGHCGFAMSDGSVLLEAAKPGGFWGM